MSSQKDSVSRSSKRVRRWRKWHKWGGLFFSCFLLPFLISGILLNHRYELRHLDVSRRWLPASYHLHNWNQGTVRGTLRLGADSVLLYGENGLFLSDDRCRQLRSWNDGLQVGAENQSFSDVVRLPDGEVFAVSSYAVYVLPPGAVRWQTKHLPLERDDRFVSAAVAGDTLLVLSR